MQTGAVLETLSALEEMLWRAALFGCWKARNGEELQLEEVVQASQSAEAFDRAANMPWSVTPRDPEPMGSYGGTD